MKPPAVSSKVKAAFDRLMKAYPVRGDNPRTPALVVFARLVELGDDAEVIVAAAQRFAAVMKAEKRDARMIPHTRTWLSQRRFDDYADALASADEGQPSPDHPLAFMVEQIGLSAWRSWLAPLSIDLTASPIMITTRTAFALSHLRKAGWTIQIEARLGDIDWRAAS